MLRWFTFGDGQTIRAAAAGRQNGPPSKWPAGLWALPWIVWAAGEVATERWQSGRYTHQFFAPFFCLSFFCTHRNSS